MASPVQTLGTVELSEVTAERPSKGDVVSGDGGTDAAICVFLAP